jgi:hypothetical protein
MSDRGSCGRCFAPIAYTEDARILSVGADGRCTLVHERCAASPWVRRAQAGMLRAASLDSGRASIADRPRPYTVADLKAAVARGAVR